MPLNMDELSRLERSILESKMEVSKILASRSRATLSKDERAALRAWADASERTLESSKDVAKYLEHFSRPISKRLQASQEETRKGLDRVRRTGDKAQFHEWVRSQFIPHVRFSESVAHVAMSSVHGSQGGEAEFHRWVAVGSAPPKRQ